MRTPRSAARTIAALTMSRASPSRWKSYCARSSVSRAPSRNSAIKPATSAADWPPSVRVRTVRAGFVDRLAAARIGRTYNFYSDGLRVLDELGAGDGVLLWNVVPTHPGDACSNRAPTRAEVAGGLRFVRELSC